MKLSRILPLVVSSAAAVLASVSPARAISWNFTITGSGGTYNGTVDTPGNNGTQSPTNLTFTSMGSGITYTQDTVNPSVVVFLSPGIIRSGTQLKGVNSTFLGTPNYGRNFGNFATATGGPTGGSVFINSVESYSTSAAVVSPLGTGTMVYSSAAVPFDIPGGATIPAVGSLFALGLMRQAKKRLAAKTLVLNPLETVVSETFPHPQDPRLLISPDHLLTR